MLNLFKKNRQPETITKDQVALVAEIHETFFTEVDRILEESKVIHAISGETMSLVEKQEILRDNGFVGTMAKKQGASKETMYKLDSENRHKIATNNAIRYFSHKYPQYKFITEESIKRICEKYGLIYGESNRYVGFIPENNVQDLRNFKIDPNDDCYSIGYLPSIKKYSDRSFVNRIEFDEIKDLLKKETGFDNIIFEDDSIYADGRGMLWRNSVVRKLSLEIAAPVKDFNTWGMEIKNSKLVADLKDPVIFKPVHYDGYKFYLIVTAWGAEASDPLVINERMN